MLPKRTPSASQARERSINTGLMLESISAREQTIRLCLHFCTENLLAINRVLVSRTIQKWTQQSTNNIKALLDEIARFEKELREAEAQREHIEHDKEQTQLKCRL